MNSYDSWKTRTPEDEANRHTPLAPQRPRSQWRTCLTHGWAEHMGYIGETPTCLECEAEKRCPVNTAALK